MEIIPAIDLRGRRVVRLLRGEYDKETVYPTTPADVALRWQQGGASMIHLVDLDGARDGMMQNEHAIRSITQSVRIRTELGGGIRDFSSIGKVLDELNVSRVILGSVLLENPALVHEAATRYPGRIVLGIDAKEGRVSTRGWREDSNVNALDLVREFRDLPIAAVIYTDIARDGTLEGPNLEAAEEMAMGSPFPLIASGGIGELSHIESLVQLSNRLGSGRIVGVIIGKALYENHFTIEQAIQRVR